jgi:hypothetical protein
LLDPRPAPARADDRELAAGHVADALRFEDERDAGCEIGLADDQPPAAADLNYET